MIFYSKYSIKKHCSRLRPKSPHVYFGRDNPKEADMAYHNRPLSAEDVLSNYWNNSIPVDPIVIAQRMGATVYSSKSIDYTGEFFFHEGAPTIVYKPSGNTRRDRFTVAHELGHFALGHDNAHRDTLASFNTTNFDPAERNANRFAAELLMPEKVVWFAIQSTDLSTVEELCDYFDVSGMAMRIRLQNLGIL